MNGAVNDGLKADVFEKQHEQEDAGDAKKDSPPDEPEVKEPEEKVTFGKDISLITNFYRK